TVTQLEWIGYYGTATPLANNDALTATVYSLNVKFSRAMIDFLNSTTAANEVDNPANYRLVTPGSEGSFQTTSCSIAGDDSVLPLKIAATTEANTYNITLQSGQPLPSGNYLLFACPTLTDTYSNALDGNADSVGGDAYSIAFSTIYPALNLTV